MKTKAMKDGNATCPLCGCAILDVLSTEVEGTPIRQLSVKATLRCKGGCTIDISREYASADLVIDDSTWVYDVDGNKLGRLVYT